MKINSVVAASIAILFIEVAQSQNVGIGTSNPQSRLHIIDGSSGYSGGYFPGITFEGSSNRYMNFISPPSSEMGLLFGNPSNAAHGGIVYNNLSTPQGLQFRTNGNINRMIISSNGNIGIGDIIPDFPLSFPNSVGDKISLYGNTGGHYGFGVAPYTLLIHTDASSADIAFGSGSSADFSETMRITGTGKLGIGVNPSYQLDISNRMRIRSGGQNVNSAGLWLNNNSNIEAAFIGMEDDTHVGLFGNNGAGWKLTMNTQNGSLKVNGLEGNSGEFLKSNGSGAAPSWGAVSTWLYNNTFQRTQTSTPVVVSTSGQYYLSGMDVTTFSIPVNTNAKLLIITDALITPNCCTGSCVNFGTNVYRNGNFVTAGQTADVCIPAGEVSTGTTGLTMLNVTPATYTFATYATLRSGSPATVTNGHVIFVLIGQ